MHIISRFYKDNILRFPLHKARTELTTTKKKPLKLSAPSNANDHSVSSLFCCFFLFFNSGRGKYSKQTSEVFPIWNKCSSFPGNRFLTSLRSDTLNKSENWDLSSSHHHLKVYFSAANEYLLHNHKNFPNIMRLMISTVQSCCTLRFWGRIDQ